MDMLRTSIFRHWHKIQNQTQTDDIPLLFVLLQIHAQEVLLLNLRVSGMQVNRCPVNPRDTSFVVVWFEGAHFKKTVGYQSYNRLC